MQGCGVKVVCESCGRSMMSREDVAANIVLTVNCDQSVDEAIAKAWAELTNIEEQACNNCCTRFENVIHTFMQEYNIHTAEEMFKVVCDDDLVLQQIEVVPYIVYVETYRQEDDDGIMYTMLMNVDQLVMLINALRGWKATCKEAAIEARSWVGRRERQHRLFLPHLFDQ